MIVIIPLLNEDVWEDCLPWGYRVTEGVLMWFIDNAVPWILEDSWQEGINGFFSFKDEDHALLFKLRWGGV